MSKLNIQQLPKDKDFLRCFVAAPGHKLVYSDINSLEPHVLAHFSKDPGLMSLYGPHAKPNDVYLWVGSKIDKWKESILKYYDPNNPSATSIAKAKKYAKAERTAVKPAYLGWMYGLGPGTMHESTGIPIEECRQILADIDSAFPGVVKFNEKLRDEWKENGGWVKQEWEIDPNTNRNIPKFIDGRPGWIYNGRYRPMGVAPDKVKDLGNRFVQSTGHDVLMQMLTYINESREGISMRPYSVDIHDATVWEVRESQVDLAVEVLEQSYIRLNQTLQWDVQIRGEVEVGTNLGDFVE
jgi:DNA polymerase I-like protein with 3'-5' exonuclease and polymerase domains